MKLMIRAGEFNPSARSRDSPKRCRVLHHVAHGQPEIKMPPGIRGERSNQGAADTASSVAPACLRLDTTGSPSQAVPSACCVVGDRGIGDGRS